MNYAKYSEIASMSEKADNRVLISSRKELKDATESIRIKKNQFIYQERERRMQEAKEMGMALRSARDSGLRHHIL